MRGKQFAVLMFLLIGLVSVDVRSAAAAVLTVTDCGDTTPSGGPGQLRRLINDSAPGDTILVPACIIRLTGASNEDFNVSGDLDISKNITIQGAGARRTIIDGGGIDRVFDVTGGGLPFGLVTISDLMVRNGMGFTRGGGIRNAGNLVLLRVVVRANGVTGAIEAGGGGIGNSGTLNAVEIAVEENFATGPVVQSGGGIHNTGVVTLTRSSVNENVVRVAEAFFSNTGGIASSGTLTLIDSTVSGNDGGHDGPGGILSTGTVNLIGSSIVNNHSQFGIADGVLASSGGPVSLTNTILAFNFNTASPTPSKQCGGAVTSQGGNLATDTSCALGGPNDAVVADAGLFPLGNHGGVAETHPLTASSPAIDTALDGLCSATDERGVDRPQGPHCDKGAFEWTAPLFADVPDDHFARGAIEAIFVNGITQGCGVGPLIFCPDQNVTRGEFAVFLLRTVEGAGFTPPPAVGLFSDVPAGDPFAPWIEEIFKRGITTGCGVNVYCPNAPVTRGQLAVLLLRTLSIPGFVPPAAVGLFVDVPAGDPFAPWIEEFFKRGITKGCQASPGAYCPGAPATRAQIAIFLVRTIGFGF